MNEQKKHWRDWLKRIVLFFFAGFGFSAFFDRVIQGEKEFDFTSGIMWGVIWNLIWIVELWAKDYISGEKPEQNT